MPHFDATQGSTPSPQAQATAIGNQAPVVQASALTEGPVLDNPHEVGDFSQDPLGPLKASLAEPEILDYIATLLASQMEPPPLDALPELEKALAAQGGQFGASQSQPQVQPQAPTGGAIPPSQPLPEPTAGAVSAKSFPQVPFAGQPAQGPNAKIFGA